MSARVRVDTRAVAALRLDPKVADRVNSEAEAMAERVRGQGVAARTDQATGAERHRAAVIAGERGRGNLAETRNALLSALDGGA